MYGLEVCARCAPWYSFRGTPWKYFVGRGSKIAILLLKLDAACVSGWRRFLTCFISTLLYTVLWNHHNLLWSIIVFARHCWPFGLFIAWALHIQGPRKLTSFPKNASKRIYVLKIPWGTMARKNPLNSVQCLFVHSPGSTHLRPCLLDSDVFASIIFIGTVAKSTKPLPHWLISNFPP